MFFFNLALFEPLFTEAIQESHPAIPPWRSLSLTLVTRVLATWDQMNGDERVATFLIEVQRMEIIIRCDQPEPLAACFSCRLCDCLDQQRAYTDPRLCAIESHDLAVSIFKSVREQSHSVPFQDGDEAGQRMWVIDLAVSDDGI